MKRAMYAFSGDPITFGHIDVVERASKAFDDVTVGIGVNPSKLNRYMFSLEERTKMAEHALSHLKNVHVTSFEGLLVDYAYENDIPVIVKGVRNSADFDYENMLHQAGESQKLGVDTHILFARPELSHVSSSMVKAMQAEHGFIQDFVPLHVKQALEEKVSKQYFLGVTGEIGSGKSYVSSKFEEFGKAVGIPVYNIDLDKIGHEIYELSAPRYKSTRKQIIDCFGKSVAGPEDSINRKELGNIVFNSKSELEKLNKIMYTPLMVRLRHAMKGKEGLILLNAALIAESDMSYLTNNNTLLLDVNKESQTSRLHNRKLSDEQITIRLESQYDFAEKKSQLENAIESTHHGKVWTYDNSNSVSDMGLKNTFNEIVNHYSIDKNA